MKFNFKFEVFRHLLTMWIHYICYCTCSVMFHKKNYLLDTIDNLKLAEMTVFIHSKQCYF